MSKVVFEVRPQFPWAMYILIYLLYLFIEYYKTNTLTGVALDSPDGKDINIIKKQGKVQALEDLILNSKYRTVY